LKEGTRKWFSVKAMMLLLLASACQKKLNLKCESKSAQIKGCLCTYRCGFKRVCPVVKRALLSCDKCWINRKKSEKVVFLNSAIVLKEHVT
jgi:hypothetical protein